MSKIDEGDDLEEIESEGEESPHTPKVMKKVIIKDKKLKIVLPEDDDEDDEEEKVIQKIIIKKKPKVLEEGSETLVSDIEKPKAKRTQKQIDAFEKVRQKKMDNAKLREKERQKVALAEQKILEEKIIKKALSIKKKQIKKQAVLEEFSDDDTPIEIIKELKSKQKVVVETKPVKVIPKYNFL